MLKACIALVLTQPSPETQYVKMFGAIQALILTESLFTVPNDNNNIITMCGCQPPL